MQSIVIVLFCFVSVVSCFSSGLSPLCDAKSKLFGCKEHENGNRKVCNDKPSPIMAWVTYPVPAEDVYKIYVGDDDKAPETKYTPNVFFTVNLRVLKYDRRYSGILLYAVNEDGAKVGEWQTTDAKPLFHGYCPRSILHSGIEPKPYLTSWQFKVPSGTGKIRFIALIKEGGPNLGEFWYPNEFEMDEGAPIDNGGIRYRRSAAQQSCVDKCAAENMLCVDEEMAKLNSFDSVSEITRSMLSPVCRVPLFLRCTEGEAGALQNDDRVCSFANSQMCTSMQKSSPAAPSCSSSASEGRVCPCKQDPSKPVLATTAAPPPQTLPPAATAKPPADPLPPCTDTVKVNCACNSNSDCVANTHRCYVGRCIPNNGCLYGEIGCPCELETNRCAPGLRCDSTKFCAKPAGDLGCITRPGDVGCACTEDVGGCNEADLLCSDNLICVRPAQVCNPGSVYCICDASDGCDLGLSCEMVDAARRLCLPADGNEPAITAAATPFLSVLCMTMMVFVMIMG